MTTYYKYNSKRDAMIAIVDINIGENFPSTNGSSTVTYCTPFDLGDGSWGVIKDYVTDQYLDGCEVVEYEPITEDVDVL